MKLHMTLVEKLVRLYSTYGGHKDESRLKAELAKLDMSVYDRETGEKILVETAELTRKKLNN